MMSKKVQIVVAVDTATGKASLREFAGETGKAMDSVGDKTSALSGLVGKLMGAFAAYKALDIARSFVETAASFEKLGVQLKTITGSAGQAKQSLDWVKQFTATTPYELQEVSEAFVQLSAYGLDAQKLLPVIGDAAASMGKGLMQGVEAVADAATGEFERLKTFGVKAKTEGDKVTFSWMQNGQEMKKTTQKNNTEIIASLEQIFKRFEGGMDEQSKTWDGMTSNMADAWTGFKDQVMQAGIFDVLKQELSSMLELIKRLKSEGKIDDLASTISDSLITIKNAAKALIDVFLFDPAASEMGLIGYALFGKKGAIMLGGFTHLGNTISNMAKGIEAVNSGQISFSQFATADFKELDQILKDIEGRGVQTFKITMPTAIRATQTAVEGTVDAMSALSDKQAEEMANVYQQQFDAAKKSYEEATAAEIEAAKSVEEFEKERFENLAKLRKESADDAFDIEMGRIEKIYGAEDEALKDTISKIEENLNAEFDAFQQLQSAWADTVSSMVGNAEELGDVWAGVVGIMQDKFGSAIGKMASDYAANTLKMGAMGSGIAGGVAGGLASAGVDIVGGIVANKMTEFFADDGPSGLEIAMKDLKAAVTKNTEAMQNKTVVDTAVEEFEALKTAADTAWNTLVDQMGLFQVGGFTMSRDEVSPEYIASVELMAAQTEKGREALAAYEQAFENLNIKLDDIAAELIDTVAAAGETELQAGLRAVNDRWEEQLKIAEKLDEKRGGDTYRMTVWLAAASDAEKVIQSMTNAIEETSTAAADLVAQQQAIAGMYRGLMDQMTGSRRQTWGPAQWGAERSSLMGQLGALDPSTADFHSQSVDLMTRIWEANQQMTAAAEETSASTGAMAAGVAKLVSYDEARMGIDDMINRLAGGDLAAVQSREFFDTQYAGKLSAIGAAQSPEEAVSAVQDFNAFLPEFLTFMNAFGLDYKDLTGKATKDLLAAKAGLPEDYYKYEAAGASGGGVVAGDLTGEMTLNFNIADDVGDDARNWLEFLNMTFAPDGTITADTKTFTLHMATVLTQSNDLNAAMEILETMQADAQLRTMTVPFVIQMAKETDGYDQAVEILNMLKGTRELQPLIVPFAVQYANEQGYTYQQIGDLLRSMEIPEELIKDVQLKIVMSMDWGVTLEEFAAAMQVYIDWWNDPATWGGVTLAQYIAAMQVNGATLPGYAAGGVFSSPHMAMIAEGGMPEAVIPMPDGWSVPVSFVGGGGNNTSGDNKKIEALLTRLVSAVESGRDVTIRVEPDRTGIVRLVAGEMQAGDPGLARGVRNLTRGN
jgi:hypothetical protein